VEETQPWHRFSHKGTEIQQTDSDLPFKDQLPSGRHTDQLNYAIHYKGVSPNGVNFILFSYPYQTLATVHKEGTAIEEFSLDVSLKTGSA